MNDTAKICREISDSADMGHLAMQTHLEVAVRTWASLRSAGL